MTDCLRTNNERTEKLLFSKFKRRRSYNASLDKALVIAGVPDEAVVGEAVAASVQIHPRMLRLSHVLEQVNAISK